MRCRKYKYPTRKAARSAARSMNLAPDGLGVAEVYECPTCQLPGRKCVYHVGRSIAMKRMMREWNKRQAYP